MVTLKSFRIFLLRGLTLSLTLLFFTSSSTAQVLSDGDVGNPNVNSTLGTIVNTVGDTSNISGGTRPGGGQNLFHSFSQFDVPGGHTALFQNSAGNPATNNIFGRITNGNPSNIFGTVDSATNFPTASLWLMNPAGFLFGPNAALNVGGSFYVNNADAINFADGKAFTALPSAQDASLSIEPAVALSFLGPNPNSEGIHFNGSNLAVTGSLDVGGNLIPGTGTISVVGRDGDNAKGIKVTGGTLTANLGKINLASVASGGELEINTLEENPNNNGQTFDQLGQIELTQAAQLTAAAGGDQAVVIRAGVLMLEGGSRINSVSTALGNGNVTIHADTVSAKDFVVAFNGFQLIRQPSGIFTFSLGGAKSGDVLINASSAELDNFASVGTPSFSFQGSNPAGGNITFEVDTLTASNFATLSSSTTTTAAAGNIVIRGRGGNGSEAQNVSISNGASVQAATFGNGVGGDIIVQVDTLDINGGAISAGSGFLNQQTDGLTAGTGAGGNITIQAATKATFSNGAVVSADTAAQGNAFLGPGAGTISITSPEIELISGATIRSQTISNRAAGNIFFDVGHLEIKNANVVANSGVLNNTKNLIVGSGNAGNINVQVSGPDSVLISGVNFGIRSNTFGSGDAGRVIISSPKVNLDGGVIQTGTQGSGSAGGIDIQANQVVLKNGGQIDSSTFGSGSGGTINIHGQGGENDLSELVSISGFSGTFQSGLFTTSNASGKGGKITASAKSMVIENFGLVRASTIGLAPGGDLTFNVDSLTVQNSGSIESNTLGGQPAGTILIQGTNGQNANAQNIEILNFGNIQSSTVGGGDGGTITVNTEDLIIRGINIGNAQPNTGIGANSGIVIDPNTNTIIAGKGRPGNVNVHATGAIVLSDSAAIEAINLGTGEGRPMSIEADQLHASGNSVIRTSTGGQGTSGDLTVTVHNDLALSGGSQIQSASVGPGNAGTMTVSSQNVTITGIGSGGEGFASGLFVNSESPGTNAQAGNLNLTVTDALTISDGGGIFGITKSKGDGANVMVTAGSVNLESGGAIATSTFGSGDDAGNAGNITVEATSGPINISGTLDTNRPIEPIRKGISNSGIFSKASVNPDPDTTTGIAPNKNAGFIAVSTPASILLANQAEISTSAEGSGTGGTIMLTAGNTAEFTNKAEVSSVNTGSGDAGGITVNAGNTILVDDSTFTVQSAQGDAGDIKFDAGFLIHLIDSTLFGSTGGGPETSGANINLDPKWIVIQNSQLLANALEGQGGNITLQADLGIFVDDFSAISASSQFGVNGSVNIQAPIQNLSGAIAPLPDNIVDIATLVGQHCAAQKGGQLSSFVEAGRDVVPPGPADFLTSPLFLELSQSGNVQRNNKGVGTLAAQRLGMGLGGEIQIAHIMKVTDSRATTRCLL